MKYQIVDRQTTKPRAGDVYYHFKNNKVLYSITAIAKDTSNDDEPMVVYMNTTTKEYYIRYLEEFLDILELEDGTIVNRFTKFNEAE